MQITDNIQSKRNGTRHSREYARDTLAMILAGGRGTRLSELTEWRVKPAVPFGGNYRIIDFSLSNCVNSGINRIGVLTQYKSQSLIRHLGKGWNFLNSKFGEFVEIIPAQKRIKDEWYEGTADSIYQNIDFIIKHNPEYVLILGGDHIYQMDYNPLLAFHEENEADVTIGCIEISKEEAGSFGIMAVDEQYRITRFEEKPDNPAVVPGKKNRCLASMGIYVFKTKKLLELLLSDADKEDTAHDFGRDIIPVALQSSKVFAWPFLEETSGRPGYWRDVGTVDSYYQANMELTGGDAKLNPGNPEWPVHTAPAHCPPARFMTDENGWPGIISNSVISAGCSLSDTRIENSVISSGVKVRGSEIINSVILPDVDIKPGCRIKNAVIDKGCTITEGTIIGESRKADNEWFRVSGTGVRLVTAEMIEAIRYRQEKLFIPAAALQLKKLNQTDYGLAAGG